MITGKNSIGFGDLYVKFYNTEKTDDAIRNAQITAQKNFRDYPCLWSGVKYSEDKTRGFALFAANEDEQKQSTETKFKKEVLDPIAKNIPGIEEIQQTDFEGTNRAEKEWLA